MRMAVQLGEMDEKKADCRTRGNYPIGSVRYDQIYGMLGALLRSKLMEDILIHLTRLGDIL